MRPPRKAPLPRRRRPRARRRAATPSPHRAPLEALGVSGDALRGLTAYLDILADWSRRVNLTGARSPADRVALLVQPVLPARDLPEPGSLIDVGAGNGSPGLVLAFLRTDLEVTLLEPRSRRWAFLREVVRRSGGPEVRVLRCRHDEHTGPPARTVTLRALALSMESLVSLVAPGGRLLVFGAAPRRQDPFEPEPGTPPGLHSFRRPGVSRET